MSIGRLLAHLPATLAIASITPDAHSSQEAWNIADVEYQEQRFDSALARYEQLAATGDPRAAELAGQMLLFGESLYGALVPRNRERAASWLEQAAAAGRPVARYLLDPSSARHRIASK